MNKPTHLPHIPSGTGELAPAGHPPKKAFILRDGAIGVSVDQTDVDLLHAAAKGDAKAFEPLMERHAPGMLRLATNLVPTIQDAEDVVQETFSAAFVSAGRFAGKSSVKTWLYAILYRQVALFRRKRKMPMKLLGDDVESAGWVGPRATEVDARLDLQGALAHLSEEFRAVVVLRELDGLSYEEIADVLQIPRGTVESRLFRARQNLKEYFSIAPAKGVSERAT